MLMRYIVGLMIIFTPLFGLLFIGAGVAGLRTTWRRRRFLQSADGIIIGVEVDDTLSDDGPVDQWAYRPILRYTTSTGETREFVSEVGEIHSKSPYVKGSQLPVLYDPDGVLSPRINSWFALWGSHLVLIAVGPVFIGCSVLLFLVFGQRVLHGD
jgi:hypothetical protein